MWRKSELHVFNNILQLNSLLSNITPATPSSPTMTVEVALNTPLAKALGSVIQPKLVEVGWSSGGVDDSALSEYIILMLVNGKTQDQIAAELSGDLLNLGPDDPGAVDFSRWLFEQVEMLHNQINGGSVSEPIASVSDQVGRQDPVQQSRDGNGLAHDTVERGQDGPVNPSMDTVMQSSVPTGPKSMRNNSNNSRHTRLMGQLSKAMDRSNDSVLHRIRPQQGTERINSHSREPPKGPRNTQTRTQRPPNGRNLGMTQSGIPGGTLMNMTTQQQMQLFAMYEEQARIMTQILSPQQQQGFMGNGMPMPMMNGGFGPVYAQPPPQQHGRSLFERVEAPQQRQNKRNHQGGSGRFQPQHQQDEHMDTDAHEVPTSNPQPSVSSPGTMEGVEISTEVPGDAVCKFNLACTKTDCRFGHQSPAAPPGTTIDLSDNCPFGAACKNRKCVARHPSPALKVTHQSEMDCKFFPNCTNPTCPFKHPTMPLCRNGADCTRENCRFTHVKTICKYNPCLNPTCPFKHADGQKRGGFEDKVWTAGSASGGKHVSERKFVDENGEEELIVPGANQAESTTSLELTA
ncbi:hypothetical protein FGG08_002686 [Glutinoglossum americanum]|uniref:Nab2-like CCCH zinc finger domain-containing protein n=1 Tax=Glutinoglossum americanum TaxID=1670608 RepID=A0A9P8I8P6_9PEZI|nr:hypothetical protein FGG08_002686 [Glutinoglossum americanum]